MRIVFAGFLILALSATSGLAQSDTETDPDEKRISVDGVPGVGTAIGIYKRALPDARYRGIAQQFMNKKRREELIDKYLELKPKKPQP